MMSETVEEPVDAWLPSPLALVEASLNGGDGFSDQLHIPRVCVTPLDSLAVVLSHAMLVEITLCKNIRVCQVGAVAASIAAGGRMAAIHHPLGEVLQQEAHINADLPQGVRIRFTHDNIRLLPALQHDLMYDSTSDQEGWTMNEREGLRWGPIPSDLCVPLPRGADLTSSVFLHEPWASLAAWPPKRARCVDVANRVVLFPDWKERQQMTLLVHGVKIRQDLRNGDVRVYSGRNYLSLRAGTGAITLHSPWVDLNVDRWAQIRIRRAEQYALASGHELTIGDGAENKVVLDSFGRLISEGCLNKEFWAESNA